MKLFDFGLATEVDLSTVREDGTFHLTGFTGSPLYMAPEVAKLLPYNFKADSYSFGILLWQIMSMKTPFEKLTVKALETYVVDGTHRPAIDTTWSENMSNLMKSCWNGNIKKRPSFDTIKTKLYGEGYSDETNMLDVSTKSYTAILSKKSNRKKIK